MAHNNIEIEIQVKVEKLGPLMKFLKATAVFQAEKYQAEVKYYVS